jgi:hypothetical protein
MDAPPCKKRVTRVLRSIDSAIRKRLRSIQSSDDDVQFVFAAKIVMMDGGVVASSVRSLGSDDGLCEQAAGVSFERQRAEDWSVMPGNAEDRAKKTRKLLALVWKEHVKGTEFEGKKQMYRLVRERLVPALSWWERVAGVEFTNTALADPEVSERVFRFCRQKIK